MSLTLSLKVLNNCSEIKLKGSPLSEVDFEELHAVVEAEMVKDQPNLILNLAEIKILNSFILKL